MGPAGRDPGHAGCTASVVPDCRPVAHCQAYGRDGRSRLPRCPQHLYCAHGTGSAIHRRRPGTGARPRVKRLPICLRHPQPPVSNNSHAQPRAPRVTAGAGDKGRLPGDRGRLRERIQFQRRTDACPKKPRPGRSRDLRRQPVQDPGARLTHGVHGGSRRVHPRSPGVAPAYDPAPAGQQPTDRRPIPAPRLPRRTDPAAEPCPERPLAGDAHGTNSTPAGLVGKSFIRRVLVLVAGAGKTGCPPPAGASRRRGNILRGRRRVLPVRASTHQLPAAGFFLDRRRPYRTGHRSPGATGQQLAGRHRALVGHSRT